MLCRSSPPVDVVPTFKTGNQRLLLLLSSGQSGLLRMPDAERLQARAHILLATAIVAQESHMCSAVSATLSESAALQE